MEALRLCWQGAPILSRQGRGRASVVEVRSTPQACIHLNGSGFEGSEAFSRRRGINDEGSS